MWRGRVAGSKAEGGTACTCERISGTWHWDGPGRWAGRREVTKDDYLRRCNFTRVPFKVGHPSDAPTPAWVMGGLADAASFYSFKKTLVRTILKSDWTAEITRIKADAAVRYSADFDKP